MSFSESYLGQLRTLVGNKPLLAVGARVLIENTQGQFLIIRRTDSGDWGLPGGSMELGETLLDVVHREAMEEANARLRTVTAFGLSSDPIMEHHTYPNGDIVQNISLLAHGYVVNKDISPVDGEASEVKFCHPNDIIEDSFVKTEFPTFQHWKKYTETKEFQLV